MATNGNTVHQEQYRASAAPAETSSGASNNPSKDEVGWYFVEQYYTTLSKNPAKLHLFYNKQSQFVQGLEAELVNVAVGRQAIQERIKELDFQDCKVRVSNVDSQASYDNIVIQVIGEISNKAGEPKKFVQTFVLAQQPAGYFLLNDILRYVNEGEEEATEGAVSETAPVAESEIPQEAVAVAEPEKAEPVEAVEPTAEESLAALDAQAVDKKLEEASSTAKDTPSTSVVDTPAEAAPAAEEAPSKAEATEAVPDPEKTAEEVAEEDTKKPEVPKDPSPSPAPGRAPAAEPEKPKGPPKPMTWASRIAAAAGPVKPVVPVVPKAAAPPAQSRPAAAAAAQPSAPAQAAEAPAQTANKEAASEWRTAGADSKRQSRQQPTAAAPSGKDDALAYVKFVTDKVKDEDLRSALGGFGELVYFDINRSKNCAFVEYAAAAGYQAAIGASPIVVNGESIVIEPRRPKAGAYGGSNYNQNRGSISGRGRFDGQRSGSQGGGRGGYAPRGRGGASRGRGGPQAANA